MHKVPTPAAAIDLGSNSFRLMIGLRSGQELVVLAKARAPISLAHGLGITGNLTPDKQEAALTAIASFRREMDSFNVGSVRCCGTEALRRAVNSRALLEPAVEILGSPIEILSGHQEAELSSQGVRGTLAEQLSLPCLIADVGGGSCELIFHASADGPPMIISLPIGTVMLAELDAKSRKLALGSFSAQVKDFLQETGQSTIKVMVATGGTAGCLAMLAQDLVVYDSAKIKGFSLSRTKINDIHRWLARMPVEQRKVLPGLEAGREEIIISGLEIYQEILATIGATGMIVSDAGVLEGILFSITGA